MSVLFFNRKKKWEKERKSPVFSIVVFGSCQYHESMTIYIYIPSYLILNVLEKIKIKKGKSKNN